MSITQHIHRPSESDFTSFDDEKPFFGSIRILGENWEYNISVFVTRDRYSLIFLDQLREAVDQAIQWARSEKP